MEALDAVDETEYRYEVTVPEADRSTLEQWVTILPALSPAYRAAMHEEE